MKKITITLITLMAFAFGYSKQSENVKYTEIDPDVAALLVGGSGACYKCEAGKGTSCPRKNDPSGSCTEGDSKNQASSANVTASGCVKGSPGDYCVPNGGQPVCSDVVWDCKGKMEKVKDDTVPAGFSYKRVTYWSFRSSSINQSGPRNCA